MELEHLLTLLRPTYTRDAALGQVTTYTTVVTNEPADFQPISGDRKVLYSKENIKTTHHAYVENDIGAKPGDVVQDENGNKYRVDFYSDMSGKGRIWRIECERLQ